MIGDGVATAKVGGEEVIAMLGRGLYRIDGTYDYSRDLVSYNKEAIGWGGENFLNGT